MRRQIDATPEQHARLGSADDVTKAPASNEGTTSSTEGDDWQAIEDGADVARAQRLIEEGAELAQARTLEDEARAETPGNSGEEERLRLEREAAGRVLEPPAPAAAPAGMDTAANGPAIRFLRQEDVVPVTDDLWPCPDTTDEFEDRRCREDRPRRKAALRGQIFAALAPAELGRFDFVHRRFPVKVYAVVLNQGGEDEFGGHSAARLVTPGAPPRNARTLPASWIVGRPYVGFPDRDAAEAWRAQFAQVPDEDDSLRESFAEPGAAPAALFAILYFKVDDTPWRVSVPPSRLEQLLAREMGRGFRRLGVPASRFVAHPTVVEGVRIRTIGWALVETSEAAVIRLHAFDVRGGSPQDRHAVREDIARRQQAADTLRNVFQLRAESARRGAVAATEEATARPSRSQIETAMNGIAGAVRECARGQPGTAIVRVTFDAGGRVADADVTSGYTGEIAACIEGAVRQARVPAFTDPSVTVTFPFVVRAAEE